MKFTSDRQRKAAFYNMRNKFSDSSKATETLVLAIAATPKTTWADFVDSLRNDLPYHIGEAGIIGNNVKGNAEIYLETDSNKDAEDLARVFNMAPFPMKGHIVNASFNEVVNSERFKMMGGEMIERFSDVEIPSDVYARKPEIYTREVKDAASLLENIIEKDGFPAGENFLDSMTKNEDRNVRAWAERNLELLQSRGLYKKIVEDVKDAGPEGGESALLNKAYVPTDLAEAIALDTKRMKDVDRGSLDRSGSKEWRGTEDIPSVDDNSYLASQWFNDSMKKQVPDVIILPGEISKDV